MSKTLTIMAAALAWAALAPGAGAQADSAPPSAQNAVFRFDAAHTGYAPGAAPGLTAAPLSLAWRHTTADVRTETASPVAFGKTLFFGAGDSVYAVNAADGTTAWQFTPKAVTPKGSKTKIQIAFNGTPAVDATGVYLGDDNATFYKLDPATGQALWSVDLSGGVRTPATIVNGVLYVGTSDGILYGISADTGAILWQRGTDNSPIINAPSFAKGVIYVTTGNDTLYAIQSGSGRILWSIPFHEDTSFSPPVAARDSILIGSGDTLYALNPTGGSTLWSAKFPQSISAAITVSPDALIICTVDGGVYNIANQGRKIVWRTVLPEQADGAPTLTDHLLLVTTPTGQIMALDPASGAMKWRYAVTPPPIPKVVTPASDTQTPAASTTPTFGRGGRWRTRQPQTQTPTTTIPTTTSIASSPIIVNGTVYVLSDDGTLSAFSPDAPDTSPPILTKLTPAPGETVHGDTLKPSVVIRDAGSGVNPKTVSVLLDGQPLAAFQYRVSDGQASGGDFSTDNVLDDGTHQLTVKAADWRGNAITRTWAFFVDSKADLTPVNPTRPGGRTGGFPGGGFPGGGAPGGGFPGGGFPGASVPGGTTPSGNGGQRRPLTTPPSVPNWQPPSSGGSTGTGGSPDAPPPPP